MTIPETLSPLMYQTCRCRFGPPSKPRWRFGLTSWQPVIVEQPFLAQILNPNLITSSLVTTTVRQPLAENYQIVPVGVEVAQRRFLVVTVLQVELSRQ